MSNAEGRDGATPTSGGERVTHHRRTLRTQGAEGGSRERYAPELRVSSDMACFMKVNFRKLQRIYRFIPIGNLNDPNNLPRFKRSVCIMSRRVASEGHHNAQASAARSYCSRDVYPLLTRDTNRIVLQVESFETDLAPRQLSTSIHLLFFASLSNQQQIGDGGLEHLVTMSLSLLPPRGC